MWKLWIKEESKQPLFKKSGAKIFCMLGHGLCRRQRPWPKLIKFFCFFLFTKRSLPFPLPAQYQNDLVTEAK
jgi:hypothetical protein